MSIPAFNKIFPRLGRILRLPTVQSPTSSKLQVLPPSLKSYSSIQFTSAPSSGGHGSDCPRRVVTPSSNIIPSSLSINHNGIFQRRG